MEILNPTEACFDEDFLNFTLEGELVDEENDSKESSSSLESKTTAFGHEMNSSSFSEVVEEELEWLSNKDAFPSVETCFGILSDNPQLVPNHQSPTSVLDNSPSSNNNVNTSSLASCFVGLKVPINFPVRSRTKRRRRSRKISFSELPTQQCSLWTSNQVNFIFKSRNETSSTFLSTRPPPSVGRRCLHCESDKTPQWRAGPMGPKTLCNACGVRYKSGRLLPEYRPANSPMFSSVLHSNSHRKVVEMRKQKQVVVGGGGGGEGFAAN